MVPYLVPPRRRYLHRIQVFGKSVTSIMANIQQFLSIPVYTYVSDLGLARDCMRGKATVAS